MIWLEQLQKYRAIAVVRSSSYATAYHMAKAVADGGMGLIEITANSDRPWDLIARLRSELPHCTIGTGTILTLADWQNGVSSGAQFMFSPHFDPLLVAKSRAIDLPMIPGAFSPTEIVTAWQAGAASVKVFPIQCLGGAAYLQALRDPLADIPLIPTGGVNLKNARGFLEAGAVAVGLGGSLFPQDAIDRQDWQTISAGARQLQASLASPTIRGATAPTLESIEQ
jgi:2-dehydro-3-deoxyphosphogluconate aldolase / (4S)-4-hydroxy-2-oxoglutarate aldolase